MPSLPVFSARNLPALHYIRQDMIIRPEYRLLLACARDCSGSDRKALILSCLYEPFDWEYLLQAAAVHGMMSQLFWRLDAECREFVPKETMERLRNHFIKSSRTNLLFTGELIRILELFKINKIPAISFKGPTLAAFLYENRAVREFGDLDIFVREQDVFNSLKLLQNLNYKKIPEYRPEVQSRILEEKNHYLIPKVDARLTIELHWGMVPAYFVLPLEMESLWERAAPFSLEKNHSVLTLSAEDLLMCLCIHGAKHVWKQLGMLVDIVKLLECRPDLDWDYIFSEYSHPDLRRMLLIGLDSAAGLLNACVPGEVLRIAAKDPVVVRLSRQIQGRIFKPKNGRAAGQFMRFQLGLKSNWMDRIHFSWRIFFMPVLCEPDVVLPRILSPFYRIIHSRVHGQLGRSF